MNQQQKAHKGDRFAKLLNKFAKLFVFKATYKTKIT